MIELEETSNSFKKIGVEKASPLIVAGIPAYNEEKTIAKVVLGAQKHVHTVIVCDDGSSDLTGEIAERLGAVVIRHRRNLGYGAALQSVFKRARELNADVLVTIDSDGQHDPSEIPRVINPIKEGIADVVLGSRFIDEQGTADMPAYRQMGVKVITKLSNGASKNTISDSQSGFRAYSKFAIETLGDISEDGMSASLELIRAVNKTGLRLHEVPVSCKYGDSVGVKTSTSHPFSHGVGLIMSIVRLVVEDRPIMYLGAPGALSLTVGTLFGFWLLNIYAIEHRIVTNLALASVTFVFMGFFMISTAITLYAILRLFKKTSKAH
ncbi:MAG: glycosyltransferase family 2 protein [Candidatus Bathyarchaeota archaeon]|nr:glycosyltransferase family 2 protein [Candidatus Bathyarchaeota archaeon]